MAFSPPRRCRTVAAKAVVLRRESRVVYRSRDAGGAMAKFAALRSEMELRGKYQNQIVTLQITITGAVFGYVLSRTGLLPLLLIVPVSSYLLCGRYVAQHDGIRRISTYIHDEL